MNSIISLEKGSVAFFQHVMFRRPQNFRVPFQVSINHTRFFSESFFFFFPQNDPHLKKKKSTYQSRQDIGKGEDVTRKPYLEMVDITTFCLNNSYSLNAIKLVVNQRETCI